MKDPDHSRTTFLARELSRERENAERLLWVEMERHGMRREDGWRIVEFTREAGGGTEIVLRPLHLYRPSPEGMECIVGILDEEGVVHARCEPGHFRE